MYKFGKADGDGQYTWKNGSIYKGKFMNGLKHGHGKWMKSRDPTSNTYEGEYFMDKKQGYGEFRWSSGNVYKGNYKNDLRNGFGEMYWTDGSIYKGNWVNGIQHGYGKMIFIDGTVNDGIFVHNVFQGPTDEDKPKDENEEIPEESGEEDGDNTYKERKSPQINDKQIANKTKSNRDTGSRDGLDEEMNKEINSPDKAIPQSKRK